MTDDLEDALSLLQCVLVARRSRVDPEGVTWAQYDVLETLRIRGPMTPSRLAGSLGISRASTSKLLRALKDLGLVEQSVGGPDRRAHPTSLTAAGKAFLARAAASRREATALARSALSPEERAVFAELCRRTAVALG